MPRRSATRSDHNGGGQSTLSTTAASGNSDPGALALAHSTATISSSNAQTDAADAAASAQSTGIAKETLPVASAGGTASASAGSVKGTAKGKGKGGEKKPQLTHFLCIPLVTDASRPQLEASMARFRREVLGEEEGGGERRGAYDHGRAAEKSTDGDTLRSNGEYPAQTPGNGDNTTHGTAATATAASPFPPSAVRPVGTLHLTLGVMSLRDDASMARAHELLRSLNLSSLLHSSTSTSQFANQPHLAHPPSETGNTPHEPPLTLSLRGLHPMHSPTRTSILYAAPHDPTARLYAFASAVRDAFAPLLVPDDRPLRLHATVVNTIYAKERRGRAGGGGKKKSRDSGKFDAREVMQRFDGFVWAEGVRVEGVAVCEMGARELEEGRGVGYREAAGVGFE
ncbi:AKAP7 2'5' RNA ligase-like domain-containing protein [Phyllosticta citribraziliensis]